MEIDSVSQGMVLRLSIKWGWKGVPRWGSAPTHGSEGERGTPGAPVVKHGQSVDVNGEVLGHGE